MFNSPEARAVFDALPAAQRAILMRDLQPGAAQARFEARIRAMAALSDLLARHRPNRSIRSQAHWLASRANALAHRPDRSLPARDIDNPNDAIRRLVDLWPGEKFPGARSLERIIADLHSW